MGISRAVRIKRRDKTSVVLCNLAWRLNHWQVSNTWHADDRVSLEDRALFGNAVRAQNAVLFSPDEESGNLNAVVVWHQIVVGLADQISNL